MLIIKDVKTIPDFHNLLEIDFIYQMLKKANVKFCTFPFLRKKFYKANSKNIFRLFYSKLIFKFVPDIRVNVFLNIPETFK